MSLEIAKQIIEYRIRQSRGAIKMLNEVLWSRAITMQKKKIFRL